MKVETGLLRKLQFVLDVELLPAGYCILFWLLVQGEPLTFPSPVPSSCLLLILKFKMYAIFLLSNENTAGWSLTTKFHQTSPIKSLLQCYFLTCTNPISSKLNFPLGFFSQNFSGFRSVINFCPSQTYYVSHTLTSNKVPLKITRWKDHQKLRSDICWESFCLILFTIFQW